jgi:hypothetical protein
MIIDSDYIEKLLEPWKDDLTFPHWSEVFYALENMPILNLAIEDNKLIVECEPSVGPGSAFILALSLAPIYGSVVSKSDSRNDNLDPYSITFILGW